MRDSVVECHVLEPRVANLQLQDVHSERVMALMEHDDLPSTPVDRLSEDDADSMETVQFRERRAGTVEWSLASGVVTGALESFIWVLLMIYKNIRNKSTLRINIPRYP